MKFSRNLSCVFVILENYYVCGYAVTVVLVWFIFGATSDHLFTEKNNGLNNNLGMFVFSIKPD